jgi:hypothetical protein
VVQTTTDASGRFRISGLAPGRKYTLRIADGVCLDGVEIGADAVRLVAPAK